LRRRPEIAGLIALAAVLNFWALGRNDWANAYYSAAARSMSTSWHNFLFASLDPSGVMTIDKPPLALWIQALSVRLFGYHHLSILAPEALIGIATVVLLYDLVRRVFGRVAGFVAAFALATTPITVALSRDNNPDALLALCCVAAVWFLVRGLQDGRTRWIVWAGVMVGLGFETKLGEALLVVPGIVAAWLWIAPRGRRAAADQLAAAGGALLAVGGAWPLLVTVTPAADRPWISGTADNSILSLIFVYDGLGRVAGQNGGPVGAPNGIFAGGPGALRLINPALGGQVGWLLGVALVGGLAILAASRLRRGHEHTGWLIAVGGSFLVTAIVFSAAHGIVHPYYVSLLAPFAAALVGATVGQLLAGKLGPPTLAAAVVVAGVACELAVLADYPDQLRWLTPVLLVGSAIACAVLLGATTARTRALALGATTAALLIAPTIWAFDTLGHRTASTFPAGGPSAANAAEASIAVPGGPGRGGPPPGFATAPGGPLPPGSVRALFATATPPVGLGVDSGGQPTTEPTLVQVISYVRWHGGGTIAVVSQSIAANQIIYRHANIAGIGGFSGRESDPSVAWLAQEVSSGHLRWVVSPNIAGFGSKADHRPGANAVLRAAERACTPVRVPATAAFVPRNDAPLYDCAGRAQALEARA
jgi:4-amino-4-deoxy-L-arabinose transferase-like glycosyltransferase